MALPEGAQDAALVTVQTHANIRREVEVVVLSWVVHQRILPLVGSWRVGNVSASFRRCARVLSAWPLAQWQISSHRKSLALA